MKQYTTVFDKMPQEWSADVSALSEKVHDAVYDVITDFLEQRSDKRRDDGDFNVHIYGMPGQRNFNTINLSMVLGTFVVLKEMVNFFELDSKMIDEILNANLTTLLNVKDDIGNRVDECDCPQHRTKSTMADKVREIAKRELERREELANKAREGRY